MDRVKLSKFLIVFSFFFFFLNILLFFILFFSPRDSSPRSLLKVFLFVLVVGVIWEFFQIYVNNYIAKYPFDTMDTISDICFDLAGGAFAVFYFFKKRIMGKGGSGI